MHSDDRPVGRILSRREALALLSAAGALTPVAGAAGTAMRGPDAASAPKPGCLVRPELIEGPYFLDQRLQRSDIRSEPSTGIARPGVPLSLTFNVSRVDAGSCAPLPGAIVDIWQCDAAGEYSGFDDRTVGFDTRNQAFLRGYQLTSDRGIARFTTVYPGWYPGRSVHIHFKIRTGTAPDAVYEFTSQVFFDEALTDRVHARPPYAAKGRRDTRNENDRFFREGGEQLVLASMPRGDGLEATFAIGLDLSDAATGRRDAWSARPPRA